MDCCLAVFEMDIMQKFDTLVSKKTELAIKTGGVAIYNSINVKNIDLNKRFTGVSNKLSACKLKIEDVSEEVKTLQQSLDSKKI